MGRTGRMILGLLLIVPLGVLGLGQISGFNERGPRTYQGSEQFATLSEAISFQSQLGDAADKAGAEIETIELTKQSPPSVHWSVIMPATRYDVLGDDSLSFQYGQVYLSHRAARNWNIFGFIFMPCVLVLAMWLLWRGAPEESLKRNEP